MAQYALIKDSIITNLYDSIPVSLGNEISGFDCLSDEQREQWGFFKVAQPDKSGYDPQLHEVTKEEHEMIDGKPVYVFEYVARYTDEQLLSMRKEMFWKNVRDTRNYLLEVSDWAMTVDIVALKNQDWYNAWSDYRKALRDITSNENLFDDNAGIVSDNLFPIKPQL